MKIKFLLGCIGMLLVLQSLSTAATPNGGLWDMGYNGFGQLGDGTYGGLLESTNIPENIVPTNVIAIAGGENFSLYLLADGSLWGMGDDSFGELGNGTNNLDPALTTNRAEMIVAGNVTAVAAGQYFGMFIKSDGSLWGMGDNSNGQLGDGLGGSGVLTNKPEMIISNGVSAVSCGFYFTLFLRTNGTLWAMGSQSYGQLGDGNANPGYYTNKPEMITNGVATIACGDLHSLFITTNGSLWVMGEDNFGQLGDGTGGLGVTVSRPEMITNGVMAIAGGEYHSLFVKTNGSLWAMGYDGNGQLGDGSNNTAVLSPEMIEPSNVTAVSAGNDHSVFIKNDGSLWSMGADHYGQLGNGLTPGPTNVPGEVVTSGVQAVSAGGEHTLFIGSAVTIVVAQVSVLNGSVVTNGQTVSFGTVPQGGTGTNITFTVTNTGTGALDLGTPTVPSGFTVTSVPASAVPPGSNTSFSVQLDTGTAGTITNELTFTNNIPGSSPFVISLVGIVTAVTSPPPQIEIFDGTTAITNGQTNVVTIATAVTFTVTNAGGQTLDVEGLTTPPGYTVTTNLPSTIPAGSNATFTVQLTTNAPGTYPGHIGIINNDPTNGSFNFPITGTVNNTNAPAPTAIISLSVVPENGGTASAGGTNGGGIFPLGSLQSILATAHDGFKFVGWTGAASGTNNPLTVTLNTNLHITANFAASTTNIIVSVSTTGAGTVSSNWTTAALKKDSRYTLTATAAAGNLFSGWTGSITTNTNPLTFVAENSLVLQANFVTNLFNAAKGSYNGLFVVSNVVSEATSGMLKALTITDRGTYSGTLLVDGQIHALSGTFDPTGVATNEIVREAGAGGSLTVIMALTSSNGLPLATGTVSTDAWEATLLARLAESASVTGTTVSAAEFTLLIPPDTNNLPPTGSPGGDGYELINVKSGTARIAGSLADGTALNQTVAVSEDGYVPLYDSLYSGKGLLLGWINLDLTNTYGVSLTWIHPQTQTGLYTNGFTNTLSASQLPLAQWTTPANFDALTTISLLDTIDAPVALTNLTASVTASGKIEAGEVSGSITPSTGLVTLTMAAGEPRLTGHGALLDATNGGGYFLTKTNAQAIKFGP